MGFDAVPHADGTGTEDVPLSLVRLERSAACGSEIHVSPAQFRRIAAGAARLDALIAEDRLIYGITSGFGPLAGIRLTRADSDQLQHKLLSHLATGVGALLSFAEARALLIVRLQTLGQGRSGISPATVQAVEGYLNAGLAPHVPEKGTVGASGDLTPMAHAVLALMGQAPSYTRGGAGGLRPTTLAHHGLRPLTLQRRDGLALVNGTAAMTAIAGLALVRLERLIDWSIRLSLALAETLCGRSEAWDPRLAELRGQPGQVAVTRRLAQLARDAARLERRPAVAHRIDKPEHSVPHQDAYTLRCVPQILGACFDQLRHAKAVVTAELNGVSDNPILVDGPPDLLHGGNFQGQAVAFAADQAKLAAIQTAVLSERQLARLLVPHEAGGLPPYLTGGRAGLDSGFMGAQVTATALVAEMRQKAVPASIQSIPTNGDNQDIVSMGTIAARSLRDVVADLARVLAIQAMATAQAVDLLGPFSRSTRALAGRVRQISAPLMHDRPLSDDIEQLAEHLAGPTACDFPILPESNS